MFDGNSYINPTYAQRALTRDPNHMDEFVVSDLGDDDSDSDSNGEDEAQSSTDDAAMARDFIEQFFLS